MNPFELSCQDLSAQETDYLEGLLEDEEQLQIELHLTFCADCVNHLDQLRRTVAALGTILVDPLVDRRRDWLLGQLADRRPDQ